MSNKFVEDEASVAWLTMARNAKSLNTWGCKNVAAAARFCWKRPLGFSSQPFEAGGRDRETGWDAASGFLPLTPFTFLLLRATASALVIMVNSGDCHFFRALPR